MPVPRERRRPRRLLALASLLVAAACVDSTRNAPPAAPGIRDGWTAAEFALLRSMSIDALPPLPPDPSNRVADDPAAAELGQLLFYERRLSSNGQVACATCHIPSLYFTDGVPVSHGVGATSRNAPTVVASAYSPWLFWDGRRDSLWSQALAPFESTVEMNVSRSEVVGHIARDPALRRRYVEVFGESPPELRSGAATLRASPFGDASTQDAWYRLDESQRRALDRAFANVGKALAAYQRRLVPGASRFDRYVRALVAESDRPAATGPVSALPHRDALDERERLGLRLFLDAGRTQCLRCHNGPLFTNQSFHRIGTETNAEGLPDFGRFLGLQAALVDPFNCLGPQSDAKPEQCRELAFVRRDHLDAEIGKFKTPTLRGVARTPPYMHDGRFATLAEVVEHYRVPPPGGPNPSSSPNPSAGAGGAAGGSLGPGAAMGSAHELLPLELTAAESEAIVAFLATLDGSLAGEARWHTAPPVAAPEP